MQPIVQRAGYGVAVEIDALTVAPAGFQIGPSFARLVVGHHVIDHAALQELADEIRSGDRCPQQAGGHVGAARRQTQRQQCAAAQPERGARHVRKLIRQPTPRCVAIVLEALRVLFFEGAVGVAAAAQIKEQRGDAPRRQRSGGLHKSRQGALALFDERRDT